MSNPLFNKNNPSNAMVCTNEQIMQNIANDLNYLRRFQSPAEFWNALQRENPQLVQKLRMMQQTMQNPMQVAMQELNARGINPNQIMAIMQKQQY